MVAQATLRQETATLIRALEIAETLCGMAESHGIVFPVMGEALFAESPYRFDFPRRGGVDRVSGRVVIFRHDEPGQWSIQFILRCGNPRDYHTEIYLQCDLRYQHTARYTVHLKDKYDLVRGWLNIRGKSEYYQTFRRTTRPAYRIETKERFLELMGEMMKFYAEQPAKLTAPPKEPLTQAHA